MTDASFLVLHQSRVLHSTRLSKRYLTLSHRWHYLTPLVTTCPPTPHCPGDHKGSKLHPNLPLRILSLHSLPRLMAQAQEGLFVFRELRLGAGITTFLGPLDRGYYKIFTLEMAGNMLSWESQWCILLCCPFVSGGIRCGSFSWPWRECPHSALYT